MAEQFEDTEVHRIEIDTLLSTLDPHKPRPAWARDPRTPAQFFASLLDVARREGADVTPVYDESGYLVALRGIRLREGGAHG